MYVLGIDLSTSGLKAIVYSAEGGILVNSRIDYNFFTRKDEFIEQDPDLWLTGLSLCLEDIVRKLEKINDNPKNIGSIGVTSTSGTLVFVDEQGNPLHSAIMYNDGRCKSDSERWKAITGSNGKRYEAIFGCVDNDKARYLINRLAVRYKIPYIDGGTSPSGGNVAVYIPSKNRCVDCQFNLKESAKEAVEKEGCTNNPNPSIIIPNLIIGSAMVAEFVNIFSGAPQLLERTFKHDTYSRDKVYTQPTLLISQCGLGCT